MAPAPAVRPQGSLTRTGTDISLYKIAQATETGSESSLADVEDDYRIMSAMERQ